MKLPIILSPIQTHHYILFPLAVIFNYEDLMPWFYSNYIQVFSIDVNERIEELQLHFFKNRLTYKEFAHKEFVVDGLVDYPLKMHILYKDHMDRYFRLLKCSTAVDMVKKCLDCGYYVYTNVDKFYIPETFMYQNTHFLHDLFLFGYDDEKQCFHTLYYNERSMMTEHEVPYDKFEIAYANDLIDIRNNQKDFHLYKKSPHIKYKFQIDDVLVYLDEYLHSKSSVKRFWPETGDLRYTWGMSTYNKLVEYIDVTINKEHPRCDLRIFTLLHDHKRCMSLRIEFLMNIGYIKNIAFLEDYRCYEKTSKKIFMNIIKYNQTKNLEILVEVRELLLQLYESEMVTLDLMMKEITELKSSHS
jgi:hypothetical protein